MAYYTDDELKLIGFRAIGERVRISKKCSIYGANRIEIGNDVRIDDFCVLSAGIGGIQIGSFVHIGVFASLIGAGKITLCDFANISSRVSIYSNNDDYSGEFMTNPMVPLEFTNVSILDVYIGEHVIIGSNSVILPGVELSIGAAIGSLSLVNISIPEFSIYAGIPVRFLKSRKRNLLELEKLLKYK
jgi:acetyltransferase-like isoleucine patch superfamily enzyme